MTTTPATELSGRLARLADLAYRRRGRVVLAWIAILAATIAIAPRLAGEFSAEFATAGSESQAAADLVAERFTGTSGDTIQVVWQAESGAREPAVLERIERLLEQAEQLEGIAVAQPPRVSRDGTIALATLELDRPALDVPAETGTRLIELAEAASGDGLAIELGGPPIRNAQEGGSPEFIGLIAAAVILLIAFGSVVAVGLPIAIALFGLGLSVLLIGVLAAVIDVPGFATAIAGVVGIGVGIDYALLILTRFRSALASGAEPHAAVVEAVTTAGRSVLVAGTTVVISFLGLFLLGVSFLYGVAVSVSLAVLIAMAASVTLLPALLAFAGHRVNRLRVPGLGRERAAGHETPAARWSHLIQRRAWPAAILGTVVLIAFAAPALGLRFGFPDAGNDQAGTTTRAAYQLVSTGFGPGANGPLLLAADLPATGAERELGALAERVRSDSGVAFVSEPRLNGAGDAAVLTVVPASSPQDSATTELVHRLRDDVIPQLANGGLESGGIEVSVGGLTASVVDQSDLIRARLPLLIAAVVGLSFLFLLAAFRSPLIALKAGVMNLLAVGAAYGVLALAAEGGWFGRLLGIDADTPVPPFMPVMMFAVLFGLSMDYEVFLLSRMREEYLSHGQTSRAVADGLAKTARVITAAAAIMVAVFLALAVSDEIFLKLLGVGMATAIFLDATVVRMVLVPALMQLFGRGNWWIPAWLDRRLPRLDVEATVPNNRRR
ncbi:MAG: MMPL family transporter [Actinobacteria bacterium]|nr:MMPL family transporter [Actinomycetota bacterium]